MDAERQRALAFETTGSAEGQMMRNKNQGCRICDPRGSAAVRHEPTLDFFRYKRTSHCVAFVIFTVAVAAFAAQPTSPQTPQEELASFRFADPQLMIELVAAEPDVVSPVAIAWDADGRLFVAEMMDYPTAPTRGRIRLLEDRDGDGHYERASVFADQFAFPNGVMPWRDGVLVTAAPNIWFLKDTDGDGVA